ncbi:hypothetical protein ABEF95_013571 [Exophiala dermatitidis]
MQALRKDVSSYFDYRPRRNASSEASTPVSEPISPGTLPKPSPRPRPRLGSLRSQSEHATTHKRIHVKAVPEEQGSRHGSGSGAPPRSADDSGQARDTRSISEHLVDESQETAPITPSTAGPSGGLAGREESHPRSAKRSIVGRGWARSPSGGLWFRAKHSSGEIGRSSSSRELLGPSDSEVLVVRTDQTPLRPPSAQKNRAALSRSSPSTIRVEAYFNETDAQPHEQRRYAADRHRGQSHGDEAHGGDAVPRKSSFNPLQFFSAPLQLIRRASGTNRQSKTRPAEPRIVVPQFEDPPLADHASLLRRNHTAEALARVSAILQDMRQSPQAPSRPPTGIKPLRWRTFSNKWSSPKVDKDHLVVPEDAEHFTAHQRRSMEHLWDTRSYTSSERNLLMGRLPNNSPAEQATYKVKRSASAQTEEFLKIDISIRGGTSYLPSEARRIHTPPLPEEGPDGKFRGFFFDYNAPRRASTIPQSYDGKLSAEEGSPSASKPSPPHSGSTSAESAVEESQSQQGTSSSHAGKGHGGRSKNRKEHTRPGPSSLGKDWYDVKLAELGLGDASGWGQAVDAKEGERRVNLSALEAMAEKNLSTGRPSDAERHLDLTVPEHLPSSPLCPRNARYWRVVKGKGSQFRGCWMHGIGVYTTQDGQGHGNDDDDDDVETSNG